MIVPTFHPAIEATSLAEQGNSAETSALGPDADGVWRAYYSAGTGSSTRIFLATSYDGIRWAKHGVVIGGTGSPRNRVNAFREGSTTYAIVCDMTSGPYNGGNLILLTSINGVDFGNPVQILAAGGGKLWQNSRIIKIGAKWTLLAESDLNGNSQWRTYAFEATALTGPWTPLNGGEPLLSLQPGGTNSGPNETSSPPSMILSEDGTTVFGLSWVNSLANTGTLDHTEIYIQSAAATDLTRWSKPRRLIKQSDVALWNGRATVQLADVWAVETDGKLHVYCSQVDDTAHGRTMVAIYDGTAEEVFAQTDTLRGNDVALKQPAVGQLLRFGASREWEPMDAFDAILTAPPLGTTATVSGDGNPSPNGSFGWLANYEQFTIPGAWALIHSAGAWELRDNTNVARYRGPSAPATDPTGTLTALAGASGSATVVFSPASTSTRAFFGGNGSPMFTAPRGSLYVRKDGTGAALWVHEAAWVPK